MFIVKILTHARPAELYCQLHSSCVSCLNSQSSESFKRFFSPSRLLHQKTMITIENDVVARDVLRTLIKFYDAFAGRLGIRNGRHFVLLFLRKAICRRTGSKMGCVELCNFDFCCASIFFSANEKI